MSDHTILLLQQDSRKHTRVWADFENVNLALEELIAMYEDRLRHQLPNRENINYNLEELFRYLDGMTDVVCLVFNASSKSYVPHDREWIKRYIGKMLQNQVKG